VPVATARTPSTSTGARCDASTGPPVAGSASGVVGLSGTGRGYSDGRGRPTYAGQVNPRSRRYITIGVLAVSLALVLAAWLRGA
jgi:hypothetical protein